MSSISFRGLVQHRMIIIMLVSYFTSQASQLSHMAYVSVHIASDSSSQNFDVLSNQIGYLEGLKRFSKKNQEQEVFINYLSPSHSSLFGLPILTSFNKVYTCQSVLKPLTISIKVPEQKVCHHGGLENEPKKQITHGNLEVEFCAGGVIYQDIFKRYVLNIVKIVMWSLWSEKQISKLDHKTKHQNAMQHNYQNTVKLLHEEVELLQFQ